MDQLVDCLLSLSPGHYQDVYPETNGGMSLFVTLKIRSTNLPFI